MSKDNAPAPTPEAPAAAAGPRTITLETPIRRGDQVITSVSLRKPMAGELRGVALAELMRADVGSVITVLPRITTPALTAHDAANLELPDFAQFVGEVLGFFMSKAEREAANRLESQPT